jgi:hypothetical protein
MQSATTRESLKDPKDILQTITYMSNVSIMCLKTELKDLALLVDGVAQESHGQQAEQIYRFFEQTGDYYNNIDLQIPDKLATAGYTFRAIDNHQVIWSRWGFHQPNMPRLVLLSSSANPSPTHYPSYPLKRSAVLNTTNSTVPKGDDHDEGQSSGSKPSRKRSRRNSKAQVHTSLYSTIENCVLYQKKVCTYSCIFTHINI